MKNIKQLLITLVVLFGLTSNAQATLITHDIIIDDSILLGSVSIEVDDSLLNKGNGLISVFDVVELNIFGGTIFDVWDFEAVIDSDNVFGGIEFLAFDITELAFVDMWRYQLVFDAFESSFNFLDIYNPNDDLVFFSEGVALSQPAEVVSEPGMALLFATGLLVAMRRRKVK